MQSRLSAIDSSTLCLTLGGELSEDIFPELKHRRYSKKKKSLNPVSSKKKIGHYDGYKMDYLKNYRHINNHNKTSQLI
jgi:hypothetical protein